MNPVEIVFVVFAETVIGVGHPRKRRFRVGRRPAGSQDVAVKDRQPFGLQGGENVLLVFKIEIDRADAQLGDAGDLVDRRRGQAFFKQKLTGRIQNLLPSFGPFTVTTLFYPMVPFPLRSGSSDHGP